MPTPYAPLTAQTLGPRLGYLPSLMARIGADPGAWQVREVGDGNLNLVFIVEGPAGGLVVKQALPYVRLVGESWPLPLTRSFFEYHALTRQAARDPGTVPEIVHFDEGQALIVMEYLADHVILRHAFIEGRRVEGLGQVLGRFLARTLFRGSDLSMTAATRKADLALFAGNVALCDITEALVFTDPYFDAPLNRFTPALAPLVAELRADAAVRIAAQTLKTAFCTRAETMLHGDLHSGSVMVSATATRIIDPEFAVYGPMGFDVGMLISNLLMAALAQPGHGADRAPFRDWILAEAVTVWDVFAAEFARLWRSERTGILHQRALYEDQCDEAASEAALMRWLAGIWRDALGMAGVEMHRRVIGLAHIAEFDRIADDGARATCEARALRLGRALMLGADRIPGMDAVVALLRAEEMHP